MTESRTPIIGEVDFTMMYVAHDAFTRDLRRMAKASERVQSISPAVLTGWATFARQLHIHHTAEDEALWPPLRAKVSTPEEAVVLEEMEIEHSHIEPLLGRIAESLGSHDTVTLLNAVQALEAALTAHMRHEEDDALPLIAKHLGPGGWKAFGGYFRKTLGLRGGAEFFPWLLDEAPEVTRSHVLRRFPPPVRLLYRRVWAPRYDRTPRW
jgi:hemerythrin-like domain-containing protein